MALSHLAGEEGPEPWDVEDDKHDEIESQAQSSSSAKLGLLPPNLMEAAPTTRARELNMAQSSLKSYAGSALIAARMPRMKTNASDGRVDGLSLLSTSFERTRLMTTALEGLVTRTTRKRSAASVPEKSTHTGFLTCAGTKAMVAAITFVLQHHCAAPAATRPRAAVTPSRTPKLHFATAGPLGCCEDAVDEFTGLLGNGFVGSDFSTADADGCTPPRNRSSCGSLGRSAGRRPQTSAPSQEVSEETASK